jgi:branched-chain amino acid transport system permease protein
LLITLLPTTFQPLALYKTLVTGLLLVGSFLYLPQGLYGALAEALARLADRADGNTGSALTSRGAAP